MLSTEESKESWDRVVERRKRQARRLKDDVLEQIVVQAMSFSHDAPIIMGGATSWKNLPSGKEVFLHKPPPSMKIDSIFHSLYEKVNDSKNPLSIRRKALDLMNLIRRKLDDAEKQSENLVSMSSSYMITPTSIATAITTATLATSLSSTPRTAPAASATQLRPSAAAPRAPEPSRTAPTTTNITAPTTAPLPTTLVAAVVGASSTTTSTMLGVGRSQTASLNGINTRTGAAPSTVSKATVPATSTAGASGGVTTPRGVSRTGEVAASLTAGAAAAAAVTRRSTSTTVPVAATTTTFTNGKNPQISTAAAAASSLSRKSTASLAATSAATTSLAASAVNDDGYNRNATSTATSSAQNASSSPLNRSQSTSTALQFNALPATQSQSQVGTTVADPAKKTNATVPCIAPPAYQRHSQVVADAAEATKTNAGSKKRPAAPSDISNQHPLKLPMGGATSDMDESSSSEGEVIPPPPTPKQRSTSTMDAGQTISRRIPSPASQMEQGEKLTPKPRSRPARIPPKLRLDPKTEPQQPQPISLHDFPADKIGARESYSTFSGSRTSRNEVSIGIHKQWPGNQMILDAGIMFKQWEPFWNIESAIAAGVTAPVMSLRWKNTANRNMSVPGQPRTAAWFEIPPITAEKIVSKISWGVPKYHPYSGTKPEAGDLVLFLWMLPIHIDPKYKRANCHLWPKGTFITVNNTPVIVHQRKQASHDMTKWEQMSYPLDLGGFIRRPTQDKTTIAICSQDGMQYFYMVAVCSYRPPMTLLKELLHETSPSLYHLTLEEATEKAMGYVKKHSMVSIEDDSNGEANDEAGKLVFSLVDPITKVLMNTPVRGQRCKHWQCFDLESFLNVNVPVSGGRWRCACCELFITYQELEVCGLTQEALKTFAREASATRDRVEFRADKTFHLLKEQPLRYKKRRTKEVAKPTVQASTTRGGNGQASGHASLKLSSPTATVSVPAQQQEPIEIIDLDDD